MTARDLAATDAVTTVIPVRNGARHLGAALASVLSQTRPPAEILVIDDGSSDGSADVARRFGPLVRVLDGPERGAGAARNVGAAAAREPWLAFLDADDRWLPRRLEAGLGAAARLPNDVHLFAQIRQFFDAELGRAGTPEPEVSLAPHANTLLVRADVFRMSGGFPEDVRLGEFIAWYARIVDHGSPVVLLDEVLAERRLHAHNTGVLLRDARADYARALKSVIDLRRARAASGEATP